LVFRRKTFTHKRLTFFEVNLMVMKLKVDGKEIPLNEFVEKYLQGTLVGGISTLKGIKEDWKKIELEITK
jgi:hypothetical protein